MCSPKNNNVVELTEDELTKCGEKNFLDSWAFHPCQTADWCHINSNPLELKLRDYIRIGDI
jgi:hypothetical protein